jgi:NADH-quinone oxidoreductase subunit J
MIMLGALVAGLGLWWLLPHGRARNRLPGVVLAAAGLGLVAAQLPPVGGWVEQSLFAILAVVAVASSAAAIALHNPVYSAIWFGMSLLSTAGLFLYQGAQFLAVATIIVYAGAILVTFLFVLMLAEPSGRAVYDRRAWEGLVSAFSGAFLVGILSLTVSRVLANPAGIAPPLSVTDSQRQAGVLAEDHVLPLGRALFNQPPPGSGPEAARPGYLIAVEVAGVLLLAALVGAAVIVGRARAPAAGPPPHAKTPPTVGGPSDG